jgi:inorganic pyrophosphatase/exopolyphosphatase
MSECTDCIIVTAGPTYLDVDAYACCVAMAELLRVQGKNAVAYSNAPCNYGVCPSFLKEAPIETALPENVDVQNAEYVIVDVSDYEYIGNSVPQQRVVAIYDHHVGFEEYWHLRIGDNAHIEFIGAAATLIYREWKKSGLTDKMQNATARLLLAAILDNTLNLTSSNATAEDKEVFRALCAHAGVGDEFRAAYFSEVQANVEADLKNAIFNDIKTVRDNPILPPRVAQLCVWNAERILEKLLEIRSWFTDEPWMINVIDLAQNCSFFVCDNEQHQKKIESVFDVRFESGVAKTDIPYLRKQIIKNTLNSNLAENSMAISIVEGWRGEIVHIAITGVNGELLKYKIKDPSFNNWYMLAMAVRNNGISDFPLCNKSFNLSYCGNDL